MDYTKEKLGFRIKKVLRYICLYGFKRTLIKVKGQYHVKRVYKNLPNLPSIPQTGGYIGIIGCGNFSYSAIAYYVAKHVNNGIRAVMDIDINKAASLYDQYNSIYYTNDAQKIISDPEIKLVFIASNHASHAEYAIKCIQAGKHVHIEKPHVVSTDQLERLSAAMRQFPKSKVFLGFNRPRSVLFRKLQAVIAKESGPLMINWFIAGHELPDDHWYFSEDEGGRVLGNLCHWTDLTLHLVTLDKAFPCTIVPATPNGAKSDFVVSVIFADRSCATITFSAKGHTFEGVREILNLHKGNVLANLSDFQSIEIDINERKIKKRLFYRDHGHEANIIHSLKSAGDDSLPGEDFRYVVATAKFFLAIREAIDTGKIVYLSTEEAFGGFSD